MTSNVKLSRQALDWLNELFDRTVFCWEGGWKKEHVLTEIGDIVTSSASFSEWIVEVTEVKKCNLGRGHNTYRLTFRVVLVPLCVPLRRWTPDEDRPGGGLSGAWCPTPWPGFVTGTRPLRKPGVPERHARGRRLDLAKGEKLTEERQVGPLRHLSELEDGHSKDDRARHIEEAVLARKTLPQPCL